MDLDLDSNLDAFAYVVGFGFYNFCLARFGLDLIMFC